MPEATAKGKLIIMFPMRCISPECQASGDSDTIFYCPDPYGTITNRCPRCETGLYLSKVEIIHLILQDPKGLVRGSDWSPYAGTKGNRWSPACERGKNVLKAGQRLRHMSTYPSLGITCYECRQVIDGAKFMGRASNGLWIPAACDEIIA